MPSERNSPSGDRARASLAVVIPTLNEEAALPSLLDALAAQSRPVDTVIVADAGSSDRTVEIALERGAEVVPGGMPAVGRNAGARLAKTDLVMFLDSDVMPEPFFVERFLEGFHAQSLDVGTCLIRPLTDRLVDRVSADATNLYLQVVQPFSPHAPGFSILVFRWLHEAIGGFDETVKLAEDHDYVQRAARRGQFGVVPGVHIRVSMRRLEKEGLTRLALKYIWCEMHALAGVPIRSVPFTYEFGSYDGEAAGRTPVMDVAWLRRRLGRLSDPVSELSSATQRAFEAMADSASELASGNRTSASQTLERIDPPDLHRIHRYLRRRRALIRWTGHRARERLAQLQTGVSGEWLLLGERRARRGSDEPRRD